MSYINATLAQHRDASERIIRYYIINGELPDYVMISGQNFTKAQYKDALKRTNDYYFNHDKTMPPTVRYGTKPTTTTPTKPTDCYYSKRYISDYDIKQDTNYFCACNVMQQIFFELYGIRIKEKEIAAAMGTTQDGTSHNQIIAGAKTIAKRYGHNVTVEFKNYSDMTEKQIGELIANQNVGVFVHDLYKSTWGHYEYLIGLCISTGIYTVANSLSGGYIEKRTRATMKSYIAGISQPSIGIVRKVS